MSLVYSVRKGIYAARSGSEVAGKPLRRSARRSPNDHTRLATRRWRFLSISRDATNARIISVRTTSSISAARKNPSVSNLPCASSFYLVRADLAPWKRWQTPAGSSGVDPQWRS